MRSDKRSVLRNFIVKRNLPKDLPRNLFILNHNHQETNLIRKTVQYKMASRYPACEHIKKPSPADIKINDEVADAIGKNYRTLPMFEKGIHEYTFKKHYSVHGNAYLKCRWAEYKKHIEERVFAPFHFLDIRDYHFYNCRNRLMPSLSLYNKDDFRMKLIPGPGVDFRGQIPIPQDVYMPRDAQKPKTRKQSKTDAKVGKTNKNDDGSKPQEG